MFNLFKKEQKPDQDEILISQLVQAGSDVTKPHTVDFFLYFKEQSSAESAQEKIEQKHPKVSVVVKELVGQGIFLVEAKGKLLPNLANMQKIRKEFDDIAVALNGTYDGWGTEIEE